MKISFVTKCNNKDSVSVFAALSENKKNNNSKKQNEKSINFKWSDTDAESFFKKLNLKDVFKGSEKETLFLREISYLGSSHTLFLGLGSLAKGSESWRQAGAALYKVAQSQKLNKLSFCVANDSVSFSLMDLQALTEGFYLASYTFDELKSGDKKKAFIEFEIACEFLSLDKAKKAIQEGVLLSESVNVAKRLGDLPGNYLTPKQLAQETQKLFKGTRAKVTVWDKKKLEKEKMGGLLAVARGSEEEPRFIIIEYKGAKNNSDPLVFVGKGLTFDTGGISIKPSASMEEMKFDMCGAGAVIGALDAIVKMNLPVNVYGLISATENMPGPLATKPGDVYVARNGKTVEVNNTDAEGRLILGEALVYASELTPAVIVDAATLTGAMVVALGNLHTGFFTRSEDLKNKILEASKVSGERVWPMPLVDEHVEDMKGTFADLSNISSGKGAGSATAAAFLEQFVGSQLPWAHFDIAGTGWAVGNRLNYCTPKGASGVMVRTFFELARQFSGKVKESPKG